MFAGVEGGTTSSKAVIIDEEGTVLGMAEGPHTNQWLLGLEETAKRIHSLIQAALSVSGLPHDEELNSIGLSLSGMDSKENKIKFMTLMETLDERVKGKMFVTNDSVGAMMTASNDGGIVVISGTGSIGVFVDPDGETLRVGGMGNLLGDEGSAYWIAHYVIRSVMGHSMGIKTSPYDTVTAQKAIFQHFNVSDFIDLLPHFYKNFEKSFIASLTVRLAEEAEKGDELCRHAFYKAGVHLGRLVRGALQMKNKSHHPDKFADGHLQVLCAGSVWKSWRFLQPGFLTIIKELSQSSDHITEVSLMKLNVGAAVGAACFGARKCLNQIIPCDYSGNVSVFYHSVL